MIPNKLIKMNHWLKDLLNFVFPARCHVCDGKLADHERFVCTHCLDSLPRTGYHRRPLNPMEERFAGHFPFVNATGHFFYSRGSAISQLMQDLKYRNFPGVGIMLGEIVGRELFTAGFLSDIDMIVPMPMHFLKQAKRGYNQTHLIAQGISQASSIPVAYPLKAVRGHRTQTALSLEERLSNTAGIFSVSDPDILQNKEIILLDDVCTTGSTLSSAATTLMAAVPSLRLHLLTVGVTF